MAIHLSISLLIFIALTAIIYYRWYPQPYFSSSGGWQGIQLIAGVDLVLGPLLTLIIFNPVKALRERILDFSVIIVFQTAALTWGIYAVHSQRPIAVVYHDGFFEAMIEESFAEQQQLFDIDSLQQQSSNHPPLYFVREATAEDVPAITAWAVMKNTAEYYLLFLYDDIAEHIPELSKRSQLNKAQLKDNIAMQAKLDQFVKTRQLDVDSVLLLEFRGRYGGNWLVLSREGHLLGVIH